MLAVLRTIILLGLVGLAVYGAAQLIRTRATVEPPQGPDVDLDPDGVDDEIARLESQFRREDDESPS